MVTGWWGPHANIENSINQEPAVLEAYIRKWPLGIVKDLECRKPVLRNVFVNG